MRSVSNSKNQGQGSLEPDSRFDLLRACQSELPLKAGLILTYSTDTGPLFATLLNLAGYSSESVQEAVEADSVAILRSIQSLDSKLRVLVHAGGFRPIQRAEKMQFLLDGLIREFKPVDGTDLDKRVSFHPKLYLFHFSDESQDDFRLIITSRNLTEACDLDIVGAFRLLKPEKKNSKPDRGLYLFLKEAIKSSTGLQCPAIHNLVEDISDLELRPWSPNGSPIEKTNFYGQVGKSEKINLKPLREMILKELPLKRIVVSPFLTVKALEIFFPKDLKKEHCFLLSCPDALNKVYSTEGGKILLDRVQKFTLGGTGEEGIKGLHAKVIFDEFKDQAQLSFGSANCSNRAWDSINWECMVSGSVSVKHFRQFELDFFEGSDLKGPLAEDYTPKVIAGANQQTWQEFWEDHINSSILTANVNQASGQKGLSVCLKILLDSDVPEKDFKLWVTPMGIYPVNTLEAKKISEREFERSWEVSTSKFSCFVEIRIEHKGEFISKTRRIEFDGEDELRSKRDKLALAQIVAEAGPMEMLDQILGGSVKISKQSKGKKDSEEGIGGDWAPANSFANLERLYIACIKEKHLLPEINRVLSLDDSEFGDDEAANKAKQALGLLRPIWMKLKQDFCPELP